MRVIGWDGAPVAHPCAGSPLGALCCCSARGLAAGRARQLGVPPERAEFFQGSLASTGLPSRYADGLVCVDAIGFARDRRAVLEESRRVLKPGARAVLTSGRNRTRPVLPPWKEQAAGTGLILDAEEERQHEPAMWQRLYQLWIEHEAELRAQLGNDQADSMLTEARTRGPALAGRQAVTVALRRPED